MLSITHKLVAGSLMLGALTCLAGVSLTTAAAQDSVEVAILEEQLREAARYYEQQQRETARLQQQFQRKQRVAREFESVIAKARAQHAKIQQWEKERSKQLKLHSKNDHRKKRLQMATTLPR